MAMLAGRKIMKVKLEADARTVGHDDDRAYIFALSVLEVNFSFGCAGKKAVRATTTTGAMRDSPRCFMLRL